MPDNNKEIEELKKQLAEERAKREKLEFEIQYEDKLTKLANQKYLEKLVEEGKFDATDKNLSVIYTQVEGVRLVNQRDGNEAGDQLLLQVCDLLRDCFGEASSRFKMVGTKFCTLISLPKADFDAAMDKYTAELNILKEPYSFVDFTNGIARLESYENQNVSVVLREAEYDLYMKTAQKDIFANVGEGGFARSRKSILMIDDSLVQLRAQKAILQDEYTLLMTTSGVEGYEIAKAKQPDLILLDYDMPIIDGKRVMELLRKSKATQNIPVVFISGVSEKNKFLEVATLNPERYLLKPVSKDELLSVVAQVLNK